jgi:hypothetical protein
MKRTIATLFSLACIGCNGNEESPDGPTYYEDIAPILSENCMACHAEEGMQPELLFDDAETTSSLSGLINAAVQSGSMPPFYAVESDECANPWGFQDDPRLTVEELALIDAWAEAGGPTGKEEDAAPLPLPRNGDLKNPTTTAFPSGKYTTNPVGEVTDEFICFSIDPGLDEEGWLEAFAVIPEEVSVVHHVLVGVDHEGVSASMVDENGIYPCFGGFGDVPATFIGGWIPGATATEFPPFSAVRVEKDARIVMQMHYHLVEESKQDGTGLALRFGEDVPIQLVQVGLLGNANAPLEGGNGLQPGMNDGGSSPEFFVPAGEGAHLESMRFQPWNQSPREMLTFQIANHMHYVGTDMRVWVERGSDAGGEEDVCLLHTPEWDFDWQQFYAYDAGSGNAPTIYPGDAIWLECEYNNSLSNPAMKKALSEVGLEDPVDVSLGEGTLDEMCIVLLGQVFDIPTTVPNQTHSGEAEVSLDAGEMLLDCKGPAGFSVDESGAVSGVAACGLDLGGALYTLEYAFEGSVDEAGNAAGTVDVSVLYLEDTANLDWTGTTSGDTLTLSFTGAGTFAGIPIDFNATVSAGTE